ncbi:MAG: hypothetical protein EXS55_04915 [Candidatus Magasanikbacteria bacterium]|nr:hypothetical protein [Candidatus Magasanikbacteria bacterium]
MPYKKIIAVGLVASLAFAGIYFGVRYFLVKRNLTSLATDPAVILSAQRQTLRVTVQKMTLTDADLDDLSDSDEKKYGTDLNKADSDDDGLNDHDEVMIFKTDPLQADTYAVGHSDSWGVAHGVILKDGKIDKSKFK